MYRYVPDPVIDIHVPVKCLEGHECRVDVVLTLCCCFDFVLLFLNGK